jgi:hypothetical protein
MSNSLNDAISFLQNLAGEKTAGEKKAFTPFPDQGLPQLLIDPASGQPFVVDPQTNQPTPATPEMLMEMGIDPAQLGMAPPQGVAPAGPQGAMPPAAAPQEAMPPQGQGGGMPQGALPPELEQYFADIEQRVGNLEGAMDQLMQIIEQSQPPPAPAAGPQAPMMGGAAPAGPQMAQAPQMG